MYFCSPNTDFKVFRDLSVRESFGHETQDLSLTTRERYCGVCGMSICPSHKRPPKVRCLLVVFLWGGNPPKESRGRYVLSPYTASQ
jgi:hypothetical protein